MAAPAMAWFEIRGKDDPALQSLSPTSLEPFGLTFAFVADPEGHLVGLSKGAVR